MAKLLQSIDVNKASGPHNIPPRILEECAMELALPLTNYFNFTLSRGNIPTNWKVANVVPIFKSLELRRKYLSLVQMYKIIFGYCDINCHHYFDIIGITRTRSKHEYKIGPKVARTNYFKYSFFHRHINDWNSLPSEVMSSPSLQSFKVSLIKYLRS